MRDWLRLKKPPIEFCSFISLKSMDDCADAPWATLTFTPQIPLFLVS